MIEVGVLLEFLFAVFACAYLTYVFRVDSSLRSAGPLIFGKRWSVFFEDEGSARPFGLFDLIRWFCLAYVKRDSVFFPRFAFFEVWRCHWCLSFWVSGLFCVIFNFPLILSFSVAGATNIVVLVYDALQMWTETRSV